MSSLKINERSEAIELIKESQILFLNNNFIFKEATGEQSLGKNGYVDKRDKTLFPDVLYYTDKNQNNVALGWELKMPDTDIHDEELLSNAIDKANRLKTNVFVLWNFKEAAVFSRSTLESWEQKEFWDNSIYINTREDVKKNREKWKSMLHSVVVFLNTLFRENIISSVPILESAENIAQDIAQIYSDELSDYYIKLGDRKLIAQIKNWYDTELMEFSAKKVGDSEKIKSFSKNILLNWINRITFANLLKSTQNSVHEALKSLIENKDLNEIKDAFNKATKSSDFFTILSCEEIDIRLSKDAEDVIKQYSSFLFSKNFDNLNQEEFQSTLENIIDLSKRELMGLYTTPKKLAKLLVYSTVEKTHSQILDPCVGSGTIASTVLDVLSKNVGLKEAHENLWASDKYRLPLQVANISLSSKDSLNLPNQVFQKDLLSLKTGENIKITNPQNGETIIKSIPSFDYIITNLPFIRNEKIKGDVSEENCLREVNKYLKAKGIKELLLKNDWYQFGIIGIERLLKDGGMAAVITSNSLLKTKGKKNFISTLFELFEVKKVIISSNGRWFKNAEVVTVILVLQKGVSSDDARTKFIKLTSSLDNLSNDEIINISDLLLLDKTSNCSYLKTIEYTKKEIQTYIDKGLSLNILFQDINWFNKIMDVTIPVSSLFEGKRGVKSTNDKFFYDILDTDGIEEEYLVPVLKAPNKLKGFFASADSKAFVVNEDKSKLNKGAQAYIKKYENVRKSQSQNKLNEWYQFPTHISGDFVTAINPEERLFWSKIPSNVIVNQRFTVLKLKQKKIDKKLAHALLNTYFSQFMIEATGFGRGLGVLDTTKDGVLASLMLNPDKLSTKGKMEIINEWEKLSQREAPKILEQLHCSEWYNFNKLVLKYFGKDYLLDDIILSIEESVQMRLSVKNI